MGEPDHDYMRLLMIVVCSEVYCEATQSGQYSKYNLVPDHELAHP